MHNLFEQFTRPTFLKISVQAKQAFPRNYCAVYILTLYKTCLLTKETGRNLRSLTQKAANVYLLFVLS